MSGYVALMSIRGAELWNLVSRFMLLNVDVNVHWSVNWAWVSITFDRCLVVQYSAEWTVWQPFSLQRLCAPPDVIDVGCRWRLPLLDFLVCSGELIFHELADLFQINCQGISRVLLCVTDSFNHATCQVFYHSLSRFTTLWQLVNEYQFQRWTSRQDVARLSLWTAAGWPQKAPHSSVKSMWNTCAPLFWEFMFVAL